MYETLLKNGVFTSVPHVELERVITASASVSLVRKQVLVEPGRSSDYTYFIERGVVSVIVKAATGEEGVQVAMIGREGLAGDFGMGPEGPPSYARVIVTIPGTAMRIATAELQRLTEVCPGLRAACLNAMRNVTAQVVQTASSNLHLSLLERCARWLAMTCERVEDDVIPVTHEIMSELLCIRRPSISMAMATLQQAGLIQLRRGRLVVLDRDGLSAVASDVPRFSSRVARVPGDREIAESNSWAAADAHIAAMMLPSGAQQ